MATVLHIMPVKEKVFRTRRTISRDYIIADQSMRPLILTLSNKFEEFHGPIITAPHQTFPVVIAIRVKITTDNYLSFSTQPSSIILIDPNVQEAVYLHNWFHANASQSTQLVNNMNYVDPHLLLPPPPDNQIMDIATAKQIEIGAVWVRSSIEINHKDRRMCTMSCPNCEAAHYCPYIIRTYCQHCQSTVQLLPRAFVSISLTDKTSSLYVTAMDVEAEKLLGYSTADLYHIVQQNLDAIALVAPKLHGRTLICCIKPPPPNLNLSPAPAFTIVVSYFLDDLLGIDSINFNCLAIQDEN